MIINVPWFLEIHGAWNFENSWSMNFLKFMVHQLFGIQCPKDFCDFGLFNRLAQAGGGGPYYMIFHYQKHTVLNYSRHFTLAICNTVKKECSSRFIWHIFLCVPNCLRTSKFHTLQVNFIPWDQRYPLLFIESLD
jgi:hypothetical protein